MKKANPKAVGGFVIVAVVLALLAVAVFGGGRFLETRKTFVVYFPGSLMGLRIGAPVEMRGIQIGTVTDTWVETDSEGLEFTIPVLMELELSRIRSPIEPGQEKSRLGDLIDKGLRAQLVSQSLVTGQQSIQLDFHPKTPVNLLATDLPYEQIPTVLSKIAKIEGTFEEVAKQAVGILAQISDLLSHQNLDNMAAMLDHLSSITKDLSEMGPELQKLLDNGDATLGAFKSLAESADGMLAENRDGLSKAIAGLRQVEDKIGALAGTAQGFLGENRKGIKDFTGGGLYEVTNLAVDAQATLEQLRRVLEELERDPARFLLGKPGQVEVE